MSNYGYDEMNIKTLKIGKVSFNIWFGRSGDILELRLSYTPAIAEPGGADYLDTLSLPPILTFTATLFSLWTHAWIEFGESKIIRGQDQ